ncbi:MAG: hypothetical protein WA110_08750 [Anaerolineaceae bacterium]
MVQRNSGSNLHDQPDPRRDHEKQRFWQILFPILLAGALLVAAFVFVIRDTASAASSTASWGQVSTVVIVLPLLFVLLVVLLLVAGLSLGVSKLRGWVPQASESLVNLLSRAKEMVKTGSDAAARPVISLRQWTAQLNQFRISINPKSRQGKTS